MKLLSHVKRERYRDRKLKEIAREIHQDNRRQEIRDDTPPQSRHPTSQVRTRKHALIEHPSRVINLNLPDRKGEPKAPIARDIWR